MTQPAADGPFPQQARNTLDPAEPPRTSLAPVPSKTPWWWWAATGGAGIPVGLLWWLLAPSGLNLLSRDPALASGSNVSAWLPRDLVLAGLFLLAGCITGALVSGTGPDGPTPRTVVLAVAAAAAGALIAWGVGVLAGALWGPVPDPSLSDSVAFSLRSYQLLAVWPGAVALVVFLGTVVRKPAPAAETKA